MHMVQNPNATMTTWHHTLCGVRKLGEAVTYNAQWVTCQACRALLVEQALARNAPKGAT